MAGGRSKPEPGRRKRSTRSWVFALVVGLAVGLAPLPALAAHVTAVHLVIEVVAVTGGAMLGIIIAGLGQGPPGPR